MIKTRLTPSGISGRKYGSFAGKGGGIVFPTQYSGFKIFYSGTIYELCLVSISDAPSGMGGVWKIRKGVTDYAVYLVEITDPYATPLRIKTTLGTKSVRLKT